MCFLCYPPPPQKKIKRKKKYLSLSAFKIDWKSCFILLDLYLYLYNVYSYIYDAVLHSYDVICIVYEMYDEKAVTLTVEEKIMLSFFSLKHDTLLLSDYYAEKINRTTRTAGQQD